MNLRLLVKLSNVVALISILLLIYWIFVFVSVEVFGFRIFRENLSQTFGMSVLGILALMGGSLMINVMFNLTRIAQKHNGDDLSDAKPISRNILLAFGISFPLIFGGLFAGDYLTSIKKETMLIQSAKAVIEANPEKSARLLNYEYSESWLGNTRDTLEFFERTERNFPYASVIVRDELDGAPVYLAFREYSTHKNDAGEVVQPERKSYLLRLSQPDRDYLNKVFDEGLTETRFTASDGNYELYYPYVKDGKRIVLYFSDYQRYGKMGS